MDNGNTTQRKFCKTILYVEFKSTILLNPQQSASQLNLQDYTILDCEPLHSIKGHLIILRVTILVQPYYMRVSDSCKQGQHNDMC